MGDNRNTQPTDNQEKLKQGNLKHIKAQQNSKSTRKKLDCTECGKNHHRKCLCGTGLML